MSDAHPRVNISQVGGENIDDGKLPVGVDRIAGASLAEAPPGVMPIADRLHVVVDTTSVVDNDAAPEAPVALPDAYAAPGVAGSSPWTNLDQRTTDLAIILDTSDATPAYVEFEVLWSRSPATPAPTSYFSESDVASVDASAEYLVRRQTRWYGLALAVLPVSPPSRRYVIERPPEALSYCIRARRGSAVAVKAQIWATQLG